MILNEIEQRQSVRQYTEKEISETDLLQILEAGRLAPSWMNVQPWHFIVVKDNETKKLLSECANGQKQIENASHVIVVVGDYNAWNNKNFGQILSSNGMNQDTINFILQDKGYNPAANTSNILMTRTMEQISYAIAFMGLQAQHIGIDTCIIGAFSNEITGFNDELNKKVKEVLNVPENTIIAGMLTLGYRQESVKNHAKKRKAFEDVVSFEKYGQK